MYRFFVEPEQLMQSPVMIKGADYNHIKNVLRLKIGESIYLSDGTDMEYECSIASYDTENETVLAVITDVFAASRELPARLTLFQGYPKGDKMETIVQKAVELGACEIVPVMMKRCVVKLDDKKSLRKTERLNSISLSAAKQAKRGLVPKVTNIMSLPEACEHAKDMDYILLPYENAEGMEYAGQVIKEAGKKENIGIFIGPEGGFETDEIKMLESIGAKTFSLGHRILRTETAGMAVLSLLMFLLETYGGRHGNIL